MSNSSLEKNLNTNLNSIYNFPTVERLNHNFHLVDPSPWPLFTSLSAFNMAINTGLYLNLKTSGFNTVLSILILIFCICCWFADIVTESTFEGYHTSEVQQGLRYGMILFIVSEIMFFFGFFWGFFHASLIPSVHVGSIWPLEGLNILNPWSIPFLNTVILLTSGAALTLSHNALVNTSKSKKKLERNWAVDGIALAVLLGLIFLFFQYEEYTTAPFNISDGIYGTTFYLATGFHGFHVIVGTILLLVSLVRLDKQHFRPNHHLGFEFAAWYWHFVDVVWLFLFLTIYYWGS